MRFRSVLMIASVAMVLVATGIGNAFATDRVYNDAMITTLLSSSSASLDQSSSGSKDPTYYHDNLVWGNTFVNMYSADVNAQVSAPTSPSGGMSDPSGTYYSLPHGQMSGPNYATPQITVHSGSYTIKAKHWYTNIGLGLSVFSPENSRMSFVVRG